MDVKADLSRSQKIQPTNTLTSMKMHMLEVIRNNKVKKVTQLPGNMTPLTKINLIGSNTQMLRATSGATTGGTAPYQQYYSSY